MALVAGCVFADGPSDAAKLPGPFRPPAGIYRASDGRFFALGYPCTDWMIARVVLGTKPSKGPIPSQGVEVSPVMEVVFDTPVSVREVAIDLSVDGVQPNATRTVFDADALRRFNTDPTYLQFEDDRWPIVQFFNAAGEKDRWSSGWTDRFDATPGMVWMLGDEFEPDAVCPDGTRGWTVKLP